MSIYTRFVRSLLFRLDAETVHHFTVETCRWAALVPGAKQLSRVCFSSTHPILRTEVAGLQFPNPIGLAAGWDKSGRVLGLLDHLGFGFAEIGSISAQPSRGNPRPRLFRLPRDRAIVVNYGLPNDGAEAIAQRLAKHRCGIPLGVNIVTTNRGADARPCSADEIFDDYAQSVALVHRYASYLTLNLSCPNAPDGKDFFSEQGRIAELLERLAPCNIDCPVFLKLPPSDLAAEQERWLAEVESFRFIRGFIFNLSPGKPPWLETATPQAELSRMPGAVAGRPVAAQMDRCIASLYSRMNRQRYSIIGSGGVFTAEDAWRKICLGASLVQIYTALVYEGPAVVRRINQGLHQRLTQHGMSHLSQAVGSGLGELAFKVADRSAGPSLP